MNDSGKKGNTVTEYALIGGLVSLAALSALFLLGHNLSDLTKSTTAGQNGKNLQQIVSMDFSGGGSANSLSGSGTSALSGGVGANGRTGSKSGLSLTDNVNGGQNASSAEGTNVAVGSPSFRTTMSAAAELRQMGDETNNPYLRRLADYAMYSASSQAAYESKMGSNPAPEIVALANASIGDKIQNANTDYQNNLKEISLNSIVQWNKDLEWNANALVTADVSDAQKQRALQLVDQIIQATHVYPPPSGSTALLTNSPSPGGGDVQYDLLWKAADDTLASGAADNTPALKTTVVNGKTLKGMSQSGQ